MNKITSASDNLLFKIQATRERWNQTSRNSTLEYLSDYVTFRHSIIIITWTERIEKCSFQLQFSRRNHYCKYVIGYIGRASRQFYFIFCWLQNTLNDNGNSNCNKRNDRWSGTVSDFNLEYDCDQSRQPPEMILKDCNKHTKNRILKEFCPINLDERKIRDKI